MLEWVLVTWVLYQNGGWHGTGYEPKATVVECQELLERRKSWFIEDLAGKIIGNEGPNAGWMKCVQAKTTTEAMDKVRPNYPSRPVN